MTSNQTGGAFCIVFFGSITAYSLFSGKTFDRYRTVARADSPFGYWFLTAMWGGLLAFSIYGFFAF